MMGLCIQCHFFGCRSAVAIVLAYIASTLLVVSWLLYTVHVTLNENREDAEEGERLARVSELLKVWASDALIIL